MATKLDKVDVVVVGMGWAGGIISAELAKAGKKVVGLERGEDADQEDFTDVKDDLRYTNRFELMQNLKNETVTSRNTIDETALPVRTRDEMMAGTDVGGGSVHWAGASYRYWPYDFEIHSQTVERYGEGKIPKDMTIQDWGITYDEMEPYYDQFEKTAGLSGEPDPLGAHRSNDYPTPPLKKTPAIHLFKKATKDLGYHPYQIAAGNLSEKYENPDGEVLNPCQYCSYCTYFGCDFGAKSDAVVTVIPTAQKTGNFELRANAYVRRVLYDGDQATGVLFVDTRTGQEFEQPADVVVLSAFTFTNNRLLLLSEIGEPYNPETRKGLIGRNFTGQFNIAFLGARGFFDHKKFNLYAGAGALGATMSDFAADNFDHTDLDFINGGAIEYRQYGDTALANNVVPKGTPGWGAEFKEKSVYYTYRSLPIWYTPAIMSWWHNYLDLDPTYKDDFGDPLIRVTNKFTDQDRNIAQFGLEKCKEIMEKMGADIVDVDEIPEEFDHIYHGGHYAGGIIMGDNPETSAVNTYMQMWDMDNLFVVGGSAFPQFGGHHPTPTIGALAYRAADGIKQYFADPGPLAHTKQTKTV